MSLPPREQWAACWQSIGGWGDSDEWYARLAAAYGEPHRHYHNGRHIAECLAEFDRARHLAHEPDAVELALWFHDAVYDPKAADNEERSADLAACCLNAAAVSSAIIESVKKLVMATKRHEAEPGSDDEVMVDVDLSILGQGEKRFGEYEEQIRQEYSWVPAPVFASKRAEILERFLTQPRIFRTDLFHDKYERIARCNLENSIGKLKRCAHDSGLCH